MSIRHEIFFQKTLDVAHIMMYLQHKNLYIQSCLFPQQTPTL